nr:RNA-directed DNA polymerase, eukaryota [Tanacetum cinerariifolium]GEV02301.1 RNA-directed DNA polymerase, eukaryota [Tanacetum cinerariifolium]
MLLKLSDKRTLWNYFSSLIRRWDGECIVMGDFNEVRCEEERLGTVFNIQGANAFNDFILCSNLLDVRLDGYSFTWSHRSASKMSKLDRFLVSDGFYSIFPSMSGICLSDHRPILFRDECIDYGATPFRLYHSWLSWDGFDLMVSRVWSSMSLADSNGMVRFKKKLQFKKKEIRSWVMERKKQNTGCINDIKSKLHEFDVMIDQGGANVDILASRLNLMKNLHDLKVSDARDYRQKAKIRWAVEGDENSKFFHVNRSKISFQFPTRLNSDQVLDLERPVACDEIRQAVWGCGEDKSPGPDGFTFEFFRKFWELIGLSVLGISGVVGSRQGDPLAPYLFVLVMESLHLSFSRTVDAGIFKGIQIGNDIMISHLFYADDAVFIGECSSHFPTSLGCAVMKAPFKYLGVMVGGNMSRIDAWDDTMVPKSVLSSMEAIRRKFFYGCQEADKKITWVKWSKVLAAKQFGGLGVSSLFSLNRALLFRWVWRFISRDNSLWCRFISAVHGPSFRSSLWRTITSEFSVLKAQGVDLLSRCLKRVGNGLSTQFWYDPWIGNVKLCNEFPRLFALELNKSISVAEKLQHSVEISFRRPVRGGSESAQLELLSDLLEVKDVRCMLDDFFLPRDEVATRWLPHLPIKLNVFAWRLYLDRLPTKSNLIRRGIQVSSPCPNCNSFDEDVSHIFFKCPLAIEVSRAVCRWWDVVWAPCGSFRVAFLVVID